MVNGDSPKLDSPELDPVAERIAERISGTGKFGQLTAGLRQAGAIDPAGYDTIAKVPTPALDLTMRRLSTAANHSLIWLGVAAGLSLTGRPGRKAAARG